jgi:hypothetical protein
MEPVLLVNHVTERRQITKVKVDRWLSLVFFPKKKIGKKIKRSVLCLKHKYMKSLRNDVQQPKEKGQKDKQGSTKHTHKTKD